MNGTMKNITIAFGIIHDLENINTLITAREFANKYCCSIRTIQRIINELSIIKPIESVMGRYGGYKLIDVNKI